MSTVDAPSAIFRSAEAFYGKRFGVNRVQNSLPSVTRHRQGKSSRTPVLPVPQGSTMNVIPVIKLLTHCFPAVKIAGLILRWNRCQTSRRDNGNRSGAPLFVAGENWNCTATVGERRWRWRTTSKGIAEQIDRIGDVDESISIDLCGFLTR